MKIKIPFMMVREIKKEKEKEKEREKEKEKEKELEWVHEIVKEFRVVANVEHHHHHEKGLMSAK
jgi:hypothetical protein